MAQQQPTDKSLRDIKFATCELTSLKWQPDGELTQLDLQLVLARLCETQPKPTEPT